MKNRKEAQILNFADISEAERAWFSPLRRKSEAEIEVNLFSPGKDIAFRKIE